ncbi:hypothetical protein BU26DRAFT_106628 [Trematosphaeria pertusa]|uniref:Uncharacterized protein n=1 Tax=Trematosphaeria pertusa TaxID=390896 RepID=A0A6A6I055_9PLEO|nr:uncharacterized protein BU26DRAFT_106628 [Trematosphaeria pertusa]KAF2243666.1 hypothetical protein BU26DRAFT_106628 [Trematosphaeria pertusa]
MLRKHPGRGRYAHPGDLRYIVRVTVAPRWQVLVRFFPSLDEYCRVLSLVRAGKWTRLCSRTRIAEARQLVPGVERPIAYARPRSGRVTDHMFPVIPLSLGDFATWHTVSSRDPTIKASLIIRDALQPSLPARPLTPRGSSFSTQSLSSWAHNYGLIRASEQYLRSEATANASIHPPTNPSFGLQASRPRGAHSGAF